MAFGLALFALGLFGGYSLYDEYRSIEIQESGRLESDAQIISENIGLQLVGVNHALMTARKSLPLLRRGASGQAEFRGMLGTLVDAIPGVRTMLFIGADGITVSASRDELIGTSFGDRDYFRTARANPDPDRVHLSRPFKTVLGVHSVNVVRSVVTPEGEFGGIVAATIDPQYFSLILRSVLSAPDMRARLVHTDGSLFLLEPAAVKVVGSGLAQPGSILGRHLEGGKFSSVFSGFDLSTQEERLMAQRTITRGDILLDQTLVVGVSRRLAALYQGWREKAVVYSLFYFLFVVLAIVVWTIFRGRQAEFERLAAARELERQTYADRMDLAMAGGGIGMWDWHVPSGITVFDERWCAMLGYAVHELEHHVDTWRRLVHPEDWHAVNAALEPHLKGLKPEYRAELRMRHRDGRWIWIMDAGKVTERDADGAPLRVVGTHTDITENKRAEARIEKLSRYYAVLSKTNEMIVRARDPEILLRDACRIAVEQGRLPLVWAGCIDADRRTAKVVASHGPATGFVFGMNVSVDPALPEGQGPFAVAVREQRTVVIDDFLEDPLTAPWRMAARAWNLSSVVACPIRRQGRVWGGIVFYSSQRDYFEPDLISVIEELAGDVSYCLDTLDAEQSRRDLQRNLQLLSRLVASSREGVYITDADNRFTMVNPAFCAITGYAESELLGQLPTILKSGRQDEAFYRAMWSGLLQESHWQGEIWDRRKNGEVFPAWISITELRDDDGKTDHRIAFFSDISEQKAVQQKVEHLAHHDLLTDLPNRYLLNDRIGTAIARAARRKGSFAVLYMDLDRFKLVNDALGHDIGDRLLRSAAARVASTVRVMDTVSRVGGDEFVILLDDVAAGEDAARVAQKIIAEVSEPYDIDGHNLVVGASIGIAVYPENGNSVEELMRGADTALIAVKQAGRGNYGFYASDMGAKAAERLRIERDLRGAAGRGEIFVVYQPQLDIASGRIIGVEVLARWQHPRDGLISPAQFIHVAEDSGLILEIGLTVMRQACTQMSDWRQRGLLDVPVAVNVSAVQFRQADLITLVRQVLGESGLPPANLELEVTESVVMDDIDAVAVKLAGLKAAGIRLALDDFGTGYSSMAYLRRIPAQRLKIDQSFVRDLPANADAAAIARAIVGMAQALGMDVLAEGVETAQQAAFLQSIGCAWGQGYLFARPMPAEALESWLLARAALEGAAS